MEAQTVVALGAGGLATIVAVAVPWMTLAAVSIVFLCPGPAVVASAKASLWVAHRVIPSVQGSRAI